MTNQYRQIPGGLDPACDRKCRGIAAGVASTAQVLAILSLLLLGMCCAIAGRVLRIGVGHASGRRGLRSLLRIVAAMGVAGFAGGVSAAANLMNVEIQGQIYANLGGHDLVPIATPFSVAITYDANASGVVDSVFPYITTYTGAATSFVVNLGSATYGLGSSKIHVYNDAPGGSQGARDGVSFLLDFPAGPSLGTIPGRDIFFTFLADTPSLYASGALPTAGSLASFNSSFSTFDWTQYSPSYANHQAYGVITSMIIQASPVPEPDPWMFMVAGLALVGGFARFRSSVGPATGVRSRVLA